MMVFWDTAGNKFLFSNENKLVGRWWPSSVRKLFKTCSITAAGDDVRRMRRILMSFRNPNVLIKYVEVVDMVKQQHIATHWEGAYLLFNYVHAA